MALGFPLPPLIRAMHAAVLGATHKYPFLKAFLIQWCDKNRTAQGEGRMIGVPGNRSPLNQRMTPSRTQKPSVEFAEDSVIGTGKHPDLY